MILQALYDLAQQEHLVDDPDYKFKPVAWILTVDADGKCHGGPMSTKEIPPDEQKKKKPKELAHQFRVPREGDRTSGAKAYFLVDKAEYVFGIDPTGERPSEVLRQRFSLFRDRINQCLKETGDEGVRAVAAYLDRVAREGPPSLDPMTQANDLFAFQYAPDIDNLVHERPQVDAYWRALRKPSESPAGPLVRCLVTGAMCSPAELVPQIKKVPGGTPSGVALVSFNKPAFLSFNWEGNDNAPISRPAAEACATALNRLLDERFVDPQNPSRRMKKRFYRLAKDTSVCFWTAPGGEALADATEVILEGEPKPAVVGDFFKSIWYGRDPQLENSSAFYALTITGTQGRAIMRGWFESTVARVAANFASYYNDLSIVWNAPKSGKVHWVQIPLRILAGSLFAPGDESTAVGAIANDLAQAALAGTPFPISILQRAILRMRAEIGRTDWLDFARRDARAALIKAVLNRRKRFGLTSANFQEVKRDMDPNNMNVGYRLGALMAVLERLQQEAMENVNASVIDRYFNGASATPKSVFVRLLKNARHHVRKAGEGGKAGLIFLLDRLIDELLSGLLDRKNRSYPPPNSLPASLSLEDQGLFILGYHHMRKWLWMNEAERKTWESGYLDAPKAFLWSKREKEVESKA